jgi:hypothetical protein
MEVPFLCIPMQGGTDFVSSNRVVFWSRLSGRFGFKRNNGGGRRRRSHGRGKKGAQLLMAKRER